MDNKFIDGLFVKAPHEKAPDFVKAKLSIKKDKFMEWLSAYNEEWVNVDIKVAKSGKWYAQLNEWKPNKDNWEQKREEVKQAIDNANEPPPPEPPEDLGFEMSDLPF